jgi:hypothetical protein
MHKGFFTFFFLFVSLLGRISKKVVRTARRKNIFEKKKKSKDFIEKIHTYIHTLKSQQNEKNTQNLHSGEKAKQRTSVSSPSTVSNASAIKTNQMFQNYISLENTAKLLKNQTLTKLSIAESYGFME